MKFKRVRNETNCAIRMQMYESILVNFIRNLALSVNYTKINENKIHIYAHMTIDRDGRQHLKRSAVEDLPKNLNRLKMSEKIIGYNFCLHSEIAYWIELSCWLAQL